MIEVRGLSKRFRIYGRPADRLREWVAPWRRLHDDFWALRDVSFQVDSGSCVGIVGPNGSGKSTLLKILAGVMEASEGSIAVNGRVGALLELGMGFHPEFTGRDNILLNGMLLGMPREEVERRIPEAAAFAEIGPFMDQPLRTYSSGMVVRLGFAVASCMEPEALIVDEALAVGDAYFQQKCVRRLREFQEQGVTILFVSHDPMVVKNLCREAYLLNEGRIVAQGAPDDVLDYYTALQAERASRGHQGFSIERGAPRADMDGGKTESVAEIARGGPRFSQRAGSLLAAIESVELLDGEGRRIAAAPSGTAATLRASAICFEAIEAPTIGVAIRDRLGNEVFGTNTCLMEQPIGPVAAGERIEAEFDFDLSLGAGHYTVTAAVHTRDTHLEECFDWLDRALQFEILQPAGKRFAGLIDLRPDLRVTRRHVDATETARTLERLFASAPARLDAGDAEGRYFLRGFYPAEGGDDDRIRWTGGEAVFALRAAGERLILEAGCERPGISGNPATVDVSVEGRTLGRIEIDAPEIREYVLPLPAPLRGRPALYRLRVAPVWRPAESGAPDGRTLGVYVRSIHAVGAMAGPEGANR